MLYKQGENVESATEYNEHIFDEHLSALISTLICIIKFSLDKSNCYINILFIISVHQMEKKMSRPQVPSRRRPSARMPTPTESLRSSSPDSDANYSK